MARTLGQFLGAAALTMAVLQAVLEAVWGAQMVAFHPVVDVPVLQAGLWRL
jgi:hypothetical protein